MKSQSLLRRGVTLLELLVVLLLLGITAALVLPALSPRLAANTDRAAALRTVITSARKQAIRRGESLRLRVDSDGVWALVSARDGALLAGGRLTVADGDVALVPTVVTIDALGSCIPTGSNGSASFDPLTCSDNMVGDVRDPA